MRCRLSPVFQLPIFGNFRDFGNLFLRPSACVLQPDPTPCPYVHPIPPKVTQSTQESAEGRGFPITRSRAISRSPDHPILPTPPPSIPIPDWRRLERNHPKSSQIGVGFSDGPSIGVGLAIFGVADCRLLSAEC